jgi:CBS domain-containing protein
VRTVGQQMSAPPVVVERSATLQAASASMLDAHAHAAVIVEKGRVCGLATARDISRALEEGRDPTDTLVGAIAQRDPPVARPDEPLAEAHARMRAAQHRVVAVVGGKHEPIGVLEDPEAGD